MHTIPIRYLLITHCSFSICSLCPPDSVCFQETFLCPKFRSSYLKSGGALQNQTPETVSSPCRVVLVNLFQGLVKQQMSLWWIAYWQPWRTLQAKATYAKPLELFHLFGPMSPLKPLVILLYSPYRLFCYVVLTVSHFPKGNKFMPALLTQALRIVGIWCQG